MSEICSCCGSEEHGAESCPVSWREFVDEYVRRNPEFWRFQLEETLVCSKCGSTEINKEYG